jgi:hypothetical protein
MSTNKAPNTHVATLRALTTLSMLCIGIFASVPRAGAQASVHVAESKDIFANSTELFTQSRHANTLYFVTSNFNPYDFGDTMEDHPVGVYFDWKRENWAIFNQDNALMPVGAAFNVVAIPGAYTGGSSNMWVHKATAANSTHDYTTLENTKGMSNALVQVTANWNPGGARHGVFDGHAVGVKYTGTDWAVFHEDGTAIPLGASYNVTIANDSFYPMAYVDTATAGNSSNNATFLDSWLLNGSSDHIIIVTQNYNPNGATTGVSNNHNIGVVYVRSHWAIYNQDGTPIPVGASFNVWVVQ